MKNFFKIFSLILIFPSLPLYAGEAGFSDKCLATLPKLTNDAGHYFGLEYELDSGKKSIQLISIEKSAKDNVAYDLVNGVSHKATKLNENEYRYLASPNIGALNYSIIENAVSQEKAFNINNKGISTAKLDMACAVLSNNSSSVKMQGAKLFSYAKEKSNIAKKAIDVKYEIYEDESERQEMDKFITKALSDYAVEPFEQDRIYVGLIRTKEGKILSLELIALEDAYTERSIIKLGDIVGKFSCFYINSYYIESILSLIVITGDDENLYKSNYERMTVGADLLNLSGVYTEFYYKDEAGVLNTVFSLAPER